MGLTDFINRAIEYLFCVSDIEIERERRFFESQSSAHKEVLENVVLRFMDNIDAKSSGLLSHASMMIAVLSISVATLDFSSALSAIVIFEIAVYIIASLGCLRGLCILSPAVVIIPDDYIDAAIAEAALRRAVYVRSRAITAIATVAFLATMIIHFVAHL